MDIIENLRVSENGDDRSEHLEEDGRIVNGVNTTQDVGMDQTAIEAAKFGNVVDRGGVPPLIREDEDIHEDEDEDGKSEASPVPSSKKTELEPRYKSLFSKKPQ